MTAELDRLPKRIRTKVDMSSGCWVWTGVKTATGYGTLDGIGADEVGEVSP